MKMKQILLSLALMMLGLSAQAQNQTYTVDGVAPQDVKKVYYVQNMSYRQADSVAVTNGKFQIKVEAPKNAFLYVTTGETAVTALLDGKPLSVDLTSEFGSVKGSELNNRLNTYNQQSAALEKQMRPLYKEYRTIAKDASKADRKKELEKQMEQIEAKGNELSKKFILSNTDNVLPAAVLAMNYYDYSYDELKKMLPETAPYYNSKLVEGAKNYMKGLEKRLPGVMYTDLVMNDLTGKEVKLSQWAGKGKYVLVDFWASWCGPCRAEMPNVVAAYKKYAGKKNFEIVGVSFDSKADAWKKAVSDLGMTWPQMSDLKGWKCAAAEAYGVSAIPSNVLLDPQGKVVASDLRGDDLQNKLKELLGE